jgi:hypothetical protein
LLKLLLLLLTNSRRRGFQSRKFMQEQEEKGDDCKSKIEEAKPIVNDKLQDFAKIASDLFIYFR